MLTHCWAQLPPPANAGYSFFHKEGDGANAPGVWGYKTEKRPKGRQGVFSFGCINSFAERFIQSYGVTAVSS